MNFKEKRKIKKEAKKAYKESLKQKLGKPVKPVKQINERKRIIAYSAIAGSRLMTAATAVIGAAAYHSYLISGFSMPTFYYIAGAAGVSMLAMAPYMKSIMRSNNVLSTVDKTMINVDKAIGENKAIVEKAITDLEKTAFNSDIDNKLKNLQNKIDNMKTNVDKAPKVEIVSNKTVKAK